MRRLWVPTAIAAAFMSIAGSVAITSAEDGRLGPVLPPPSLMDGPINNVRAVDSSSGTAPSAVVTAKTAPASVKADAALPGPEPLNDAPARKSVWWKPWTWFSGSSKSGMTTASEPAKSTQMRATQPGKSGT